MSRESAEQRAERLVAELRAASAEAAGVVKDLRRAMKEARVQVEDYIHDSVQAALDDYVAQLGKDAGEVKQQAATDIETFVQARVKQAQAMVEAAATLEILAGAVAREVARHTQFIDGEPVIVYDAPGKKPTRFKHLE